MYIEMRERIGGVTPRRSASKKFWVFKYFDIIIAAPRTHVFQED